MKPETQGAAQRTLYPLAPCCHAFMFSGWRWGGVLQPTSLQRPSLVSPHGVLIWGRAGFRAPRERGLASARPCPVCALPLGRSCFVLPVGVWTSLSSLPSFSAMKEKAEPSPGVHSGPGPLSPAPLSRKTVRLSYWSSVMSDLGQFS